MKLRLNKIVVGIFILIIFNSCSQKHEFRGDWGAIDSYGSYSELCFSDSTIEIYDELAGSIASQTYSSKDDSLITNILSYRMNWINADSLNLVSDTFMLRMMRIKTGYKLSDYTDENDRATYTTAFYNRMDKWKKKELKPSDGMNSNHKTEEEIIEIGKQN